MKNPTELLKSAAIIMLLPLVTICTATTSRPRRFEPIATYKGPGAIEDAIIGPGPTPDAELLYLSYMYVDRTLDLVAVDPGTGRWRVFANPAKGEYGAIMVLGPDGNLYLGTRPHAHILRFDTRTGTFTDIGEPAPGESYIWQLTVGSDGRIYGCTYPSSKMVRFDPVSGKLADLGRMDPKELYGRWIAGSDDGYAYEAIGTAHAHLVAYRIANGEHRDLLPSVAGILHLDRWSTDSKTPFIYRGTDGQVYASCGKQYFHIRAWTMRPIPADKAAPVPVTNRLVDGRIVTVEDDQIIIRNRET